MSNRRFRSLCCTLLLSSLVPLSANFLTPSARAATTTRLSVTTSGAQATSSSTYGSLYPAISTNGRYVTFLSSANNLASNDTNNLVDVYLRDIVSNTTTLISGGLNGAASNGQAVSCAINSDGRYVAFANSATNLVSGTTGPYISIFVRDTVNKTTVLASPGLSGAQPNESSYFPAVSATGRYVTYYSAATNLVSGDTNALNDVFVRDTVSNTTTRISVAASGAQATGGDSTFSAISGDGRYIAYQSTATNLVTGDTNGQSDVFVRDTVNGTTTRVSVSTSGTQANNACTFPAISSNGRYVTFQSAATNLVTGDINGQTDVFMRDLVNGTTTRVSLANDGSQGNNGCGNACVNSDGRYGCLLLPPPI